MDQIALVADRIEGGRQLLERLAQHGFAVAAAWWGRSSEDGQWSLCIVTSAVDEEGILKAYRRLHPVFYGESPLPAVEPLEVKLVSPRDPAAEAVLQLQRRYPGRLPAHLPGYQFGGMNIEEGYVYAPAEAARSV